MSLQKQLDALSATIASFHEPPAISDGEWQAFVDNAVVALTTGGESSRFASVLGGKQVQKSVFELPNGDTMIEMTIRMYRDAGFKKFVALVFHNAHTTEDRLGDGSALGVEITYSHDPEMPVGRGGAIRHAIENGSIPMSANLIVANPSDMFVDFPDSFPHFIATAHLEGVKKGMLATAVVALGQASAWNGFMVDDNRVVDMMTFPFIPVPAHAGVTLFSPDVLPRFKELFSLTEKSDFEPVLFSLLSQEKKLWSAGLLEGRWIQVKDVKGYNQLLEYLALDAPPTT